MKNPNRLLFDSDIEGAAVQAELVAGKLRHLLKERLILCNKLRSLGVDPEELMEKELAKLNNG